MHKAAKGELRLPLPAGLEYDETGAVRITPDEAVADAISTVFSYFDQLASARQVMLRLLEEDRKLPRRSSSDRQVRWVTATYTFLTCRALTSINSKSSSRMCHTGCQ